MASYGTIYEFRFDDINGDDVDIFIAKKNYTGSVTRRALGRTPILKRERSGNILGTSLEIYAECKVDGEFAQLYTSSADEFRVEVYKRQNLLWRGFVSPELYSEPDIAPPYDVQIIATDGLGELKNYDFVQGERPRSFLGHLNAMLMYTGLDFSVEAVSGLQYYDDGWIGRTDMMSVVIDMSHKDQEDCYAVLQSMLASVNACITQQDCKWMVIRESDLYNLTDRLSPIPFGSMNECDWWPIGNLSADIIPAKKSLTLVSKNQYKSVLGNSDMTVDAVWAKEYDAHYDIEEGCYRLPEQYSAIVQNVNFHDEVGYRLVLNVSARNIGEGESPQMLGVMVRIDGRMYQAGSSFWLHQLKDHENKYGWSTIEGYIEIELPEPSKSDTRSDAKSIDIILPLYKYDNSSYAYATSVEVTLFNVSGNMPIGVYRCALSQYDQYPGTKIEAIISNDAREDAGEIELAFGDGEYAQPAADVFRSAIPLSYDSEVIIKRWRTPAAGEGSYLSIFARDYAMQVALPRMRYRGKLNVPSNDYPRIPMLFARDNTYYFLNTYSFDLLNSELEVELISIPNARVEIESETVTELPSSGSGSASSSGGGGTGGGGTSGGGGSDILVDSAMSDTSTNPVQNKVIKQYVDKIRNDLEEDIENLENSGAVVFDVSYTANPWSNISGQVQTETTVDAISQAINNGSPIYVRFAEGIAPVEYAGVTPESTVIDLWLSFVDSEEKRSRTIRIRSHNIGWNWEAFDTDLRGNGTVDSAMSDTSTNPVQNKVVKKYVDDKITQIETGGGKIEYRTFLTGAVDDAGKAENLASLNAFLEGKALLYYPYTEGDVTHNISLVEYIVVDGVYVFRFDYEDTALSQILVEVNADGTASEDIIIVNKIFDSKLIADSTNAPQTRVVYEALQGKQDTLVDGVTIKTVNGQSILGEGNLEIQSGAGSSSGLLTQISVQLDAVESLLDELNDSEIPLIETINQINGEVI